MREDARDEAVRLLGELLFAVLVKEDVLAVLEQGHIRVHAAAVDAEHGLGHERRMEAAHLRDRLDRHLKRHDVVRRQQRVGVLEVDLMLPLGHLVMAGLDLEAHLLEHQTDLASHMAAVIDRRHIEVASRVRGARGRQALLIRLKQEELHLGADVERVAHVLRALERLFQNIARVARERRAVGIVHVADEPRGLARRGLPRKDRERVEVGAQILIRFMDAREALDRAAVDHDLVLDDLLDL